MKLTHSLSLAMAFASYGAAGIAAENESPKAHHPTAAAPASQSVPGKPGPDMARLHTQMTAMQAMHDKMMAAKSPAERDALMAEHTKVMQDGMGMMNSMSSGGMGGMGGMSGMSGAKGDMAARHQTMETRMEMMQAMMQMMMDRLPAAPAR